MRSRFFFSYVTCFFFILFAWASCMGESGAALSAIIFALSFAILYCASDIATNLTSELKIVMGIIFAVLAAYDLYMLPVEYSLALLAAFIPMYFLAYAEQRLGRESYLIVIISIFQVFSLVFMFITGYGAIAAKFEFATSGFMFDGAKFEEMVSACAIFFVTQIILSYASKNLMLDIDEKENSKEE